MFVLCTFVCMDAKFLVGTWKEDEMKNDSPLTTHTPSAGCCPCPSRRLASYYGWPTLRSPASPTSQRTLPQLLPWMRRRGGSRCVY